MSRTPTAEGFFRRVAKERGISVTKLYRELGLPVPERMSRVDMTIEGWEREAAEAETARAFVQTERIGYTETPE